MTDRLTDHHPAPRAPYVRAVVDHEEMNLPAGKTCGDCVHFRHCNLIFGHIAADEVCDWSPSRFAARALVKEQPHG
jgi:hypothetical protein